MNKLSLLCLLLILAASSCEKYAATETDLTAVEILYTMPEEGEEHEGTWLQWPHHHQYGVSYREGLDATWVAMTRELVSGETVHIIAYDQTEQDRITDLLQTESVPLSNIDFKQYQTDDCWVRDNGPIFVFDHEGNLHIEDWGFNAWGNKRDEFTGLRIESANCDVIPTKIAGDLGISVIDLNLEMINEGGSIEIDGNGTLMACKSSILNKNRNRGMSRSEAEVLFKQYLGATNFIWLEGRAGLDITDQHIDGFARFGNSRTIVTMNENDLLDYDVRGADIEKLFAAKNRQGEAYDLLYLPLTQNDVVMTDGTEIGYKGSYVNYYIANTRVLVPNYNDPNDSVANQILQGLYPDRIVVGIDVRNLYANGGMVHCVTQQQPMSN